MKIMRAIMRAIVMVMMGWSFGASATELLALKDYLKKELSSSAKLSKESFALDANQKKEITKIAPEATEDSYTFFYGKTTEGKLEKACTIVPQNGKEGSISLGVCFNPIGLLESVTILSHSEDRGRQITEETFLKQFKGKKVTDSFTVGSDVDGISGASRSSKAVSEALRKSSYAYRTFVMGVVK